MMDPSTANALLVFVSSAFCTGSGEYLVLGLLVTVVQLRLLLQERTEGCPITACWPQRRLASSGQSLLRCHSRACLPPCFPREAPILQQSAGSFIFLT